MKTPKLKDISRSGVMAHVFEYDLKDGDYEMEPINIVPYQKVSIEVSGILEGSVGVKQGVEDEFISDAKDSFGSVLILDFPAVVPVETTAPFIKPYVIGKGENLKIKIYGKGV